MLMIRTSLLTALVLLAISPVTHAMNTFPVATGEQQIMEAYQEGSDIPFQLALNLGLNVFEGLDNQEPELYVVEPGDNLYRIALKHNISLDSLMDWNNLNSDLIHPDDELIVSNGEEESLEVAKTEPERKVAAFSAPVVVSAPPEPKTPEPKAPEPVVTPPAESNGEEMLVTATAYTAYCAGCSGTTAYGIDLRANPNQKVIAVDPRIIPLGTKVWVEGYGEAIAGDTGGAIKGNKIDVFIPSYDNAMAWGVKKVKLRVLN